MSPSRKKPPNIRSKIGISPIVLCCDSPDVDERNGLPGRRKSYTVGARNKIAQKRVHVCEPACRHAALGLVVILV